MDSVNKPNMNVLESLGLSKPKQAMQEQKLGQEDFIKLMTTQMNHQDPMKPMANGEFLSEMAQFSTVSGLKEIKDSFNSLANSLKSSQALQASSMVGRKVLIPGSLSEGTPMKAAVEVHTNVADLKVSIVDDKGALVKEINLGNKAAGVAHFSWDGMLDANQKAMSGNYTIRATGMIDGKTESLNTLISDTVQSVSLGSGGQSVSLTLANAGSAGLADVKEIL
ncbi:MAG: flagellar hook assembly protein FlgD [Gammaproteobacteria bacterium]|nr:MAG: flagellar hook assembly protein FlgD [Gammaproteobacteria bacterium]